LIYPKSTPCRELVDLCGIWQFKLDPKKEGKRKGWHKRCFDTVDIGVPGSWNEQLQNIPAAKDHVGDAWYYLEFHCPPAWQDRVVWLWFGAVSYRATVWLNGQRLGHHEGGWLPFQFSINKSVRWDGVSLLAVKVNHELNITTLPPLQEPEQRIVPTTALRQHQPAVSYDFFPYSGIHRPVRLYTTAATYIDDITVTTDIRGTAGLVTVSFILNKPVIKGDAMVAVAGHGAAVKQHVRMKNGRGDAQLTIPRCRFWGIRRPNLYRLTVTTGQDEYSLDIGVRTVKVKGNQFLLNGKPVYFKGFGKHEDFHVIGKGLSYPLVVADFELLDWINANSFRTSHYPYAEEWYDMADRRGILIIDEPAAVGISANAPLAGLLKTHQQQLIDLYHRDKNHPSVVMWSVANEPMSWDRKMLPYFREVMKTMRSLEKHRPITGVVCSQPHTEQVAQLFDLFCVNRYPGQALHIGRFDKAAKWLSDNLDAFYKKFKKPVFVTEFGAEAIPGFHANPPEIWSEEYQQAIIKMDIDVIRSKSYTIGEHVWNFAEFKTAQELIKTMYNRKGVFTRERRPKMAAHWLKEKWKKDGK
jgi:beta-glucuronidase